MGLILFFSVVGLVASVYSVKTHYAVNVSAICDINETFNCDVVNKSTYSQFLGIPVAFMGVGAYLFFLLSLFTYKSTKNEMLLDFMGAAALIGFLFSLYLTYVEAYVLYTWCLVCLSSQLSILVILISTLWLRSIDKKPQPYTHA